MRNKSAAFHFFHQLTLFEKFTEEQLLFILKNLRTINVKAGEEFIKEFEKSSFIGIIFQGEAEVLKWDQEQKMQFKIEHLKKGSLFGEMAFIDDQPRSATIKASKDSIFLLLQPETFNTSDPEIEAIYNQLLMNITKIKVPRLRLINESYVKTLKKEVRSLEARSLFGKFFIAVIIIFGIGGIFDAIPHGVLSNSVYHWAYLGFLCIPIFLVSRLYGFSLAKQGITTKHWKKSLIDGICVSALLFITYFLLSEQLSTFIAALGIKTFPNQISLTVSLYLIHSFLQEWMARGITQTILQKFYDDKKGIKTVFITSLIFGIFHFHISYTMAILAFTFSLLLGFVYIRTYNLIGVTLVHFSLGVIALLTGLM